MLQNKKKDYHYANINVVSKYSENTARIDRCREHVSMLQTASRTTAMSNDKTRKKTATPFAKEMSHVDCPAIRLAERGDHGADRKAYQQINHSLKGIGLARTRQTVPSIPTRLYSVCQNCQFHTTTVVIWSNQRYQSI